MRICMVTKEFPPNCGGLGYHVYHLSKKLVQRGHLITILSRGAWKRSYYEEIDGVPVYRLRFILLYPFYLQLHGFFLNQQLKALQPHFDIVHLHNPALPAVHTPLPMVVTEHGIVKSFIAQLEPLDIFSLLLKMSAPIYIYLDRKVLNAADRIIAISQSCAQELQTFYGVANATVVANGVDTNFFIPAESKTQSLQVLYAGALTTAKGLPDLIAAASYVCQRHPTTKFILAGRGPMERKLKRLVNRLNLDANFFFTGFIDQQKLREYYQMADVFVLPSYHEGLPTVLLEAMSCGLPCVATDVAGNSEVVVDGDTGFLTPPKKPRLLAEAILKLLADGELRRTMGDSARKRAEECYDWDIITDQVEGIYASLVS